MSYRMGTYKKSFCFPTMRHRQTHSTEVQLLGHFCDRKNLQRGIYIRNSLHLFLSLTPVTEVAVIFMSLVFEPETEAEGGHACKP